MRRPEEGAGGQGWKKKEKDFSRVTCAPELGMRMYVRAVMSLGSGARGLIRAQELRFLNLSLTFCVVALGKTLTSSGAS